MKGKSKDPMMVSPTFMRGHRFSCLFVCLFFNVFQIILDSSL